jgi:hypothetical protein
VANASSTAMIPSHNATPIGTYPSWPRRAPGGRHRRLPDLVPEAGGRLLDALRWRRAGLPFGPASRPRSGGCGGWCCSSCWPAGAEPMWQRHTPGRMVLQCPRSAAVVDCRAGWRARTRHGGQRGPPAAAGSWPWPCPRQDRRDEPCAGARRRPPIGLPARPMGNPATGPVVTYLSSVVLMLGCCLPGQAGSPCTPHQPAVPITLRRGAIRAALIRRSQVGPLPSSAAAALAIQPRPEPGQPCRQQMIVIAAATGTEKGAEGAMRLRFVRGLLAVCPVLGRASGGFACPLADRMFAPSLPKSVSRSGWRPSGMG